MRILGLDIGSKRIGVAISDALGLTAQGLATIGRTTLERDMEAIEDLVRRYDCTRIVVGLPKRTDGSLGPEAQGVLAFVERLKEKVELPILLWDERFTTVMAEKALLEADLSRRKRRKVIDRLSAVLILQSYLDTEDWKDSRLSYQGQ